MSSFFLFTFPLLILLILLLFLPPHPPSSSSSYVSFDFHSCFFLSLFPPLLESLLNHRCWLKSSPCSISSSHPLPLSLFPSLHSAIAFSFVGGGGGGKRWSSLGPLKGLTPWRFAIPGLNRHACKGPREVPLSSTRGKIFPTMDPHSVCPRDGKRDTNRLVLQSRPW